MNIFPHSHSDPYLYSGDANNTVHQTHGGQDIYDNFDRLVDDFSVTTNYLGPCESAICHIQKNLHLINHYPRDTQEPYKSELVEFLYKHSPLSSSSSSSLSQYNHNVLFGNGASELIDLIIRLQSQTTRFTSPKPQKYYVMDTQYMEYERSCKLHHFEKSDTLSDADVVCIVNPCNPTGEYIKTDVLMDTISKCKPNTIVLIDESMQIWIGRDFRTKSILNESYFIQTMASEFNIQVYVIHSWTKIFSCTGLRIGTAVCPNELTCNHVKHHQNPWNCNILALEYLSKCFRDTEYLETTWKTTESMRTKQINDIQTHFPDWKIYGASFLSWFWIELPDENSAERLYNASKKSHMPVRWGKIGYNKPKCIRVAVRKQYHFDKLIGVWKTEFCIETFENVVRKLNPEIMNVCVDDLYSHEYRYEDSCEKLFQYLISMNELKTIPSIIVDKKSMVIIDGHHRIDVIKKLGIDTVKVIAIDYVGQYNIVVHPDNPYITHEMVVEKGLSDEKMDPKSTKHMIRVNNKLYPIIVISKIILL